MAQPDELTLLATYSLLVLRILPMSTPSLSALAHHGVSYLPTQGTFQSPVSVNDLEHKGIRYVRVQYVDLINTIRCRVIPLPYFKKLLGLSRPGLSTSKVGLGIAFLTLAEGFRHVFDMPTRTVTDNNHLTHAVRLEIGSMLLTYLQSDCAHMLLDTPAYWAISS